MCGWKSVSRPSGGAVLGGGRNIGHRAAAGRGSVTAARDITAISLATQAGPCCVPVGRLLQDQEVSIPPPAFVLVAVGWQLETGQVSLAPATLQLYGVRLAQVPHTVAIVTLPPPAPRGKNWGNLEV